MEYTGIGEIDRKTVQLNNELRQIGNTLSSNISKKLDQHLKKQLTSIKSEILGCFLTIALTTFQEIFMKRYGKNYDVQSLNGSIDFYLDNNLSPHIINNMKNFKFNSTYFNDKRSFNQNVRANGDFQELMGPDELDAMDDIAFFGLTFWEDNPYDYAVEEMDYLDENKIFKQKRYVVNPSEVFKEAEFETLLRYTLQYEQVLKPIFKKKYGVIL